MLSLSPALSRAHSLCFLIVSFAGEGVVSSTFQVLCFSREVKEFELCVDAFSRERIGGTAIKLRGLVD